MTASTPPDDPTLLIHAYVDGELDPANALEIERRLAADPALAAERDRVAALRATLHRHFPREAAPAGLRARVAAIGAPRRTGHPSWFALAASVALAAIVGSSSTYLAFAPQQTGSVSEAVVDGNMVSARAWPDHPAWMRAFMTLLRQHAPVEPSRQAVGV